MTDWPLQRAVPLQGGVPSPARRSPRLANRPGGHLLELAIARKALLRDGVIVPVDRNCAGGPCAGVLPSSAEALVLLKIKRKSARCGIKMSDEDARSFLVFLRASA